MAVVEAMYFSKPIILTDKIVSANKSFANGKNGFIVDSESAQAMADGLILLKENENLRARMGRASKMKSRLYSTGGIVRSLEALYEGTSTGERCTSLRATQA